MRDIPLPSPNAYHGFVKRSPDSHKGDNGKVAIIGGSLHQHGAPIFSALAAEASGVDLIYLALPLIHQHVARTQSLNFQVHPFRGDELAREDLSSLVEMLATVDCAVIGPGLSRMPAALKLIRELIESAPCPLVADASALQSWTLDALRGKTAVVTPHLGELERMGIDAKKIGEAAKKSGVVIHLKGHIDRIAGADGKVREVTGGDAGLTVGGTGDALAGLICGLIAQGTAPAEACVMASTVIKRAGTLLSEKNGCAYTTCEVIAQIPHLLHTL